MLFTGINMYSLLSTTFFALCSGFVLLSSAAGSNIHFKLFTPGESLVYQWKSTVLLNDIEETSNNVGFSLNGKVTVNSVWGSGEKRILMLELMLPKLQVKSRKAPSPEGFVTHPSNLDSLKNEPFVVTWNRGVVENVLISKDEQISLRNLKKGLASLIQFQILDGDVTEIDASGQCSAAYTSISPNVILKTKVNCTSDDLENQKHADSVLGATIKSTRNTEFLIDESGKFLRNIVSRESHRLNLHAKEELGGTVELQQVLHYEESKICSVLRASSFEEALSEVTNNKNLILKEESLLTETERMSEDSQRKKFYKEVDSLRENLKTEHLGSLKAARAFLQLLQTSKRSSSEDILKSLNSKKNARILPELYDVMGYTQTKNSHMAVMKNLHLDSDEHVDFIERYLWALSFSIHPNADILEDLLNKYRKYTSMPDQVQTTLILTMSSMARTLALSQKHTYELSKLLRNVEETVINGLDYAKDEDRYVFFNALKNLQSPSTIPKLISFTKNGTLKEEALAWRALKSFSKEFWSKDLLKSAERTLYQLDKKHDTSSRTLAADILLNSRPNDETLTHLLYFVASNETNYEIKQYVFQSIRMLSERCNDFNQRVQSIIKKTKKLNNYSSLSPRGLSTALTRDIFKSSSSNGSLVSVQEIKSGIVKRGLVDLVVDKNGISKEIFTLGIFSGGLSSFMSSNDDAEEESEEAATAGMELAVMGTQIRPFVFFEGQGELMGLVWSGTASEMTPAFQALILLQDHEEYLRLGNGFVAKINLKGAISFDLSGKIEISLWNRNAQSLIKKSAGYIANGIINVDTSFINSKVEFEGSIEPKLNLEIDADFSSKVKLCMRLSQPDSTFRHSISKIEEIPGSRYQLKITRNKRSNVPGITYALNRKNNEMCSAIFS